MSRPNSLPDGVWKLLADATGGVTPLSAHFGVSPQTVWRWAHGYSPTPPIAQRLLARLAAEYKIPSGSNAPPAL